MATAGSRYAERFAFAAMAVVLVVARDVGLGAVADADLVVALTVELAAGLIVDPPVALAVDLIAVPDVVVPVAAFPNAFLLAPVPCPSRDGPPGSFPVRCHDPSRGVVVLPSPRAPAGNPPVS